MKLELYLEKTFGKRVIINGYNDSRFPYYLQEGYCFLELQLNDVSSVLMLPENMEYSFKELKKHYQKVCELTNGNCVFVFDSLSTYRRNKLIEENLPFIVSGQQLYMPFLGLSLSERIKKDNEVPEALSPATQALILFLYYNKWDAYNATELAIQTNMTKMTASRAIRNLLALGLVKEFGENTRKQIMPLAGKQEFLNKAKVHLKSPVQKVIYLKKLDMINPFYISGLDALSHKTMLAADERDKCIAIDKKLLKSIPKTEIVNKEFKEVYGAIQVELWKYDPGMLTNNSVVDDISLILSLDKIYDERTEKMIGQIKRKHEW